MTKSKVSGVEMNTPATRLHGKGEVRRKNCVHVAYVRKLSLTEPSSRCPVFSLSWPSDHHEEQTFKKLYSIYPDAVVAAYYLRRIRKELAGEI